MPEEVFALIALLSLGTFTLTGLRMYLGYRVKRLQSPGGQDVGRLEQTVVGLRDEVYQLRSEVSDLGERVDFAERLLAQAREGEQRRFPAGQPPAANG